MMQISVSADRVGNSRHSRSRSMTRQPADTPPPRLRNGIGGSNAGSGEVVVSFGDDIRRETAMRIEHDNPGWFVIWGIYTRQYVAFPLFRTHPGTVLSSNNPEKLIHQMQRTSAIYASARVPEGETNG